METMAAPAATCECAFADRECHDELLRIEDDMAVINSLIVDALNWHGIDNRDGQRLEPSELEAFVKAHLDHWRNDYEVRLLAASIVDMYCHDLEARAGVGSRDGSVRTVVTQNLETTVRLLKSISDLTAMVRDEVEDSKRQLNGEPRVSYPREDINP